MAMLYPGAAVASQHLRPFSEIPATYCINSHALKILTVTSKKNVFHNYVILFNTNIGNFALYGLIHKQGTYF
jgi:hypothetical protein